MNELGEFGEFDEKLAQPAKLTKLAQLLKRRKFIASNFRGRGRFDNRRQPLHKTNERIRVPAVRVIGADGEQLGVMDTRDAIQKAREIGLDLVEIASNAQPPVCRIIDYGKFLYEQKKKQHEAKKKQVTVTVKEIKFRPATDDHDYSYRKERAREWLGDGDKVRATIAFRGREMSHRELGSKILAKLRDDLTDIADVEVAPKMEGYQMFAIFVPKKSTKPAGSPKPAVKKDSGAETRKQADAEKSNSSAE